MILNLNVRMNYVAARVAFVLGSMLASSSFAAATKVAVDAKASMVEWKGSKVTGSSHNGTIQVKEASVELDGDKLVGGQVVIDMNSIVNLDLTDKSYNEKLVGHLKSEDFFDVAKFPASTLTIKGSEIEKDGSYKVKGDLKIKNETHPVVFTAKLAADKKSAETNLVIDRTQWNVRYGSGKFFKNLGDKMIADTMEFKVKLAFSAPAVGAAPAAKPASAPAKKK